MSINRIGFIALAAMAVIVSANAAVAQSLNGRWACHSETEGASIVSDVTFESYGLMRVELWAIYYVPGQNILGHAKYNAEFTQAGDTLIERPQGAEIVSFMVNGQDMPQSPNAKALGNALVGSGDTRARLQFWRDTVAIDYPAAVLNCMRYN